MSLFPQFEFALILSTYVDSMYLVWINPLINFTFSDYSVFLKNILAGDINSLNLLVGVGSECNVSFSRPDINSTSKF